MGSNMQMEVGKAPCGREGGLHRPLIYSGMEFILPGSRFDNLTAVESKWAASTIVPPAHEARSSGSNRMPLHFLANMITLIRFRVALPYSSL
ncbi:uncharacterized protein BO95DRAFT_448472 [Aspergillus brunneoviolaceus CBS 621.78]|uniref:Uncharacterized protein n=1 Tax=Aspergillus brunneoviolaceus CBS 621.78 TaxID=1450534 RepID=A0ACD1FRX6_9EURO|nr:hypothetical protein BO95DRAFT_448472 [Aspergillus brunneoviolaceus CBS 621.78]RAH39721.1 hypothetical protein BO95DRAFT_448472 [Aspergillus brunneoviolaceus CBS 621.78]